MGWLNWLFEPTEEVRAEPEEVTPPVSDVLLSALLNNETITREKALTLPAVSGAVDFISNAVACMPVKLYKYKDGKVEEVEKDARVKLLNGDTGDTLDGFQMKKAMVQDYLLGKGGYCYIQKSRNDVIGLHYVEDRYIEVWKSYEPIYKEFKFLVMGQEYKPYEFIKLLRNTRDGASGVGLTVEISKELETAYQTLLYQLGMVKSGGNKKGFLKSQRRLGQDEINVLKQAWANMYANNTENVVVLNNGLEFQEASSTSVEMQMNESKKTLQDEINNLFHISDDFDMTFKLAIYPIVKAFETALNRDLLLEKEKKNYFFEFDIKEIIRASLKERYEAYKLAKETGFMTINEIRRAENMNWIEGLDVVNVGLGAVLYDTNTHRYYTPNTGESMDSGVQDSETAQDEMDKMLEGHELAEAYDDSGNSAERNERYNDVHDSKTGRFGSKGGGGSSKSGGSGGGSKSSNDNSIKKQVEQETEKVKERLSNNAKPFEKEPVNLDKIKERGGLTDQEAQQCAEVAESVFAKAQANEPQITQDVIASVADVDGQMYGLDFRMKQPTSMAGKIGSDAKEDEISFEKAGSNIKDAIRYTAVIDEDNFTNGYENVKQSLENKGYTEMRCKNFYTMYEDGTSCQKAVQCVYANNDGYKFELQFHTPASQGAKELNHPLYEEQRNATTSEKRKKQLDNQMREIGKNVKNPDGVLNIKSHS